MVTKLIRTVKERSKRSVLAKIFMVTKLLVHASDIQVCSVLAKIHMVTKPSLK